MKHVDLRSAVGTPATDGTNDNIESVSTAMRNFLASSLIGFLLASPLAHAQNPTPPPAQTPGEVGDEVLRITTNLVQTDVAVFDRKGKFVDGLTQNDFELKVDGKAQPLSFLDRIGSRGDAASVAADNTPSKTVTTRTPTAEPSRTITFFVDDLHLTPETIARARQVLNNFIDKQMTQGTQGLIVAASGRVGFLAQPTSDKAVLKAAAQRISYQSRAALGNNERPVMTEVQAFLIDRGDRDALAFQIKQTVAQGGFGSTSEQYVRTRARNIRRQAAILSSQIVSNLESVVRSRPVSATRQIVFFVSDGFPIDTQEADIVHRLRRVADQAARRNVVIYTVDARGLEVGGLDASSDVVVDSLTTNFYSPFAETSISQEVLRTLAADTGGRALLNNNNLESLVANVLDETSNYYLLGWRPDVIDERTGEPKFRRIEIQIKGRPELKVRARRGFFNRPTRDDPDTTTNSSAAIETTSNAALNRALTAGNERRDVPVALYGAFINDAASGSVVTAAVQVTSDDINFANAAAANGNRRATINLACVVLDEAGKAVYSDGRDVQLGRAANADKETDAVGGNLITMFSAPVTKPGLYQFRVAARDAQSGRIGTAFQWIEVPELKPGKPVLSSLLITETQPRATAASTVNAGTLDIDRTFRRTARLRLQLFIYNAAQSASAPDLTMELQVSRAGKNVLGAPAHAVNITGVKDNTRIPYGAEIPLSSLAPGTYTLQATVTDRATRKSAAQTLDFTVE